MTITFPLTLPNSIYAANDIMSMTFRRRAVVGQSRSPFSGVMQVYRHPGQWWEVDVRLQVMSRIAGEKWVAMLSALNGREGTFLMGDPLGRTPQGVASGTALLMGSHSAQSTALTVDGFGNSATVLRAGDWVQVGSDTSSRLYKVLQNVTTNGSGQGTLDVWPRTREIYADNSVLVYSGSVGVWRLADNEQPWELVAPNNLSIAFTAVEAL